MIFSLLSLQANGEMRRIDYVGEPNHPQPQDPPPNSSPSEQLQAIVDAAYPNLIENDEDDSQKIQQPETISFAKGTYLEFVDQQKHLKP